MMLFLIWILNLVISIFNAVGCGYAWNYTKLQGGIAHFLNWMGAVMAACGFTWCILIPLTFGVKMMGYLSPEQAMATLELGYIVIIPAVLGSGLVITIDSWARFIKQPGLLNGGVAAYNTFAQVHNTMNAIQILPGAFNHVGKILSGDGKRSSEDDGKGKVALLIVFLVAASALSGILLTRWIILGMAKRSTLPQA